MNILTPTAMRSERIVGLLFTCVFLSSYFPSSSLTVDKTETISFIRDILHYQVGQTSVSAFVCWDQSSLLRLSRALSVPLNVFRKCRRREVKWFEQQSRTLFLLDADCSVTRDCLKEFDSAKLFRSPHRWLMLKGSNTFTIPSTNSSLTVSKTEALSSVYCGSHPDELTRTNNNGAVGTKDGDLVWYESMLAEADVLTDSDITLATKNDNRFEIIKVYRRRPKCPLIVENMGYWTKEDGISALRLASTSLRRSNLMGTQLTASFVITDNDTLDHLTDYRMQHIDAITKVNYPLTSHLIDILNGSRRFVWTDSWGYKNPTGEWNGMMGWLERKEADLGGTPLFFTPDRTEVIEYISMTTPTTSKFIFRQPPLSYVSNIFILPFRWTVWVAACLLVMLSILVIFCISSWEDKNEGEENDGSTMRLQGRWGDVCLMAIGAVAQQGSITEPKSFSGRMATVLMFVVLMFLYTSYSANIVSLLQSQSSSIRSLDDLLHSRIQLAVDDTVFFRHYFPIQTEPVRRAIWEQKVSLKGSKPKFLPITEGVKQMQKGLFAFHVETGVGYKVVSDTFREDEKCGLSEIAYLQLIDPWYAIQKNSPFKEMFKIGMRRLQESGLQSREVQRLYTKKPICSSKGSSFVSVGLLEVLPALEWLMGCISLAVGVFLLELLYSRYIPILQECLQGNNRFREPSFE